MWDSDKVNERRLDLLLTDPSTAPHARAVLVIDESEERKNGTRAAHVEPCFMATYTS